MFTLRYLPILIGQYSIIPAVIIGIIRYRKISGTYYPFVYFCWLGLLTELFSSVGIKVFHTNAAVSNIYVLFEFLLLLWQFRDWGVFRKTPDLYRLLLYGMPLAWVVDTLIIHSISEFNSLYRVLYSLVLVVMSINYLNTLFFEETRNILRNPRVLIILAWMIYFSFKVLTEIYFLFQFAKLKELFHWVLVGLDIVNLLANFTFAVAMLWVPKKDNFLPR